MTGLDIGATIRVADLKLPASVAAAVDKDLVVASIAGAMTEAAEPVEGEAAEEAVAEAAEE